MAGMNFRELQTMMQQRGFKYEPKQAPPGGYSWMNRAVFFRQPGGIGPNAKLIDMPIHRFLPLPQQLFGMQQGQQQRPQAGAQTAGLVFGQQGAVQHQAVHPQHAAVPHQTGAAGAGGINVMQHVSDVALRAQGGHGQRLSVHTVMYPQGEAVVVQAGVPDKYLNLGRRRLHAADSAHEGGSAGSGGGFEPHSQQVHAEGLAKQGSPVGRHLSRRARAAAAHVFFDRLARQKQRGGSQGGMHGSKREQAAHMTHRDKHDRQQQPQAAAQQQQQSQTHDAHTSKQ